MSALPPKGFRLDLGWIKLPIFNDAGEPRHRAEV
jgi:hypothetical protein